jgi:hypothetical protein
VLSERDLLVLSKNIGSNWKAVGNGLKFNWAQLEQFEKARAIKLQNIYQIKSHDLFDIPLNTETCRTHNCLILCKLQNLLLKVMFCSTFH